MTHQNNYANDRLALYAFESVVNFLNCWTNLKLRSAPPLQLGEKYFHLFPNEADPIWGVSIYIYLYILTKANSSFQESLLGPPAHGNLVQE